MMMMIIIIIIIVDYADYSIKRWLRYNNNNFDIVRAKAWLVVLSVKEMVQIRSVFIQNSQVNAWS
jgi:hypothetical protein